MVGVTHRETKNNVCRYETEKIIHIQIEPEPEWYIRRILTALYIIAIIKIGNTNFIHRVWNKINYFRVRKNDNVYRRYNYFRLFIFVW